MDENALISQTIQKALGADYSVESRTDYHQYDIDSKGEAGLMLVIRNPLIESDPEPAKEAILKGLGEIEALKPYLVAETNTNHMERMAKELEYFRAQELTVNQDKEPHTTIHDKLPDWFRELPKRGGWNLKHALNVTKTDTGVINIQIDLPKDVAAEDIVKNMENRKATILETLAKRVVKYSPNAKTQEEKDALSAQVKNLEMSITAESEGDRKTVRIYFMSKDQLAATKQPGGISADQVKPLSETNPLLALQNGEDDHAPGKPQPHLQKALSRAILFSGDKHADILPFVMGREDMRRMVGKSLTTLKENSSANPDLVKRIDAFLADPVFKDQNQWGKEVEKQEFVAEAPRFFKSTGDYSDPAKPYEPGVMRVDIKLPADKFKAIRAELAGTKAAEGQAASPAAIEQAIDAHMKPLVDAMVTTIENQQHIANHILEQEAKAPATNGVLEKAATALVTAAEKLSNWVDRVESKAHQATPPVPPVAAPSSDEVMAASILAAAGVATTAEGTLAGAIAASGPTSLLTRAEKAMEPGQVSLGV